MRRDGRGSWIRSIGIVLFIGGLVAILPSCGGGGEPPVVRGILASGNTDNTVKLWRVSDGALIRTLTGHMGQVQSVSFSPR